MCPLLNVKFLILNFLSFYSKHIGNFMKRSLVWFVTLPILLSSCTYSITMAHTQGQATDLVDENATITPSATVRVPVKIT